ncbi:MAG: isoprenylcysteine carboxylmethyltransferase family protein [Woeseiaceae bacterium]|nr:isoprenylcysteine carboxylmethyltransferase family protein [Woeseiaceae bacterium]
MADTLLMLLLANFAAIGLLPILFFRRDGTLNLRWMLTAAPFFAVPLLLVLGRLGALQPLATTGGLLRTLPLVAVLLAAGSIALLAATVATHRVPLALWHQDNDAPVELVTWGPYAHMRHPFYTSFLLALVAAALALPHATTFASLAYAFVALTLTARREERRLACSELSDDYLRYVRTTGRFFPLIGLRPTR